MFKDNSIIITTSIYKKELLKNNTELKNIKIYTLSEFNKLYYYDYNNETILYVMNNYHVIYEIAKIYLNNLTYIEDKKYQSDKLNFLSDLKKDLINNNKLIINKLFKESLKNKNIYFYNLPLTKELEILKEELNIEVVNSDNNNYTHPIYELNTIEDEVVYVANSICDLITNGIDIKHIFITNLNDEYYNLVKRIFTMYNIPFTLNDNSYIFGTYLVNKFLELYSDDMNSTLEQLKEYVDNEETETIYNQILSIVNNYAFTDNYNEVLPMIKYDLKNTPIRRKNIINSVHEESLDSIFTDEDYVFLLSFNQGIIPHIYKDEQYLTDKELSELNISLTVDKNTLEREKDLKILSNIKNLIITYKKKNGDNEYQISNINEVLGIDPTKVEEKDYSYSNNYNKITLAKLKDEYNKYGTTSDTLYTLSATYKDLPYNAFDNKYKTISVEDLKKKMDNFLSISYTSIDNYYKCPFSYYLSNILDLNIYEDSFDARLGTLFHAVLEKYRDFKGTYDELWVQEINSFKTPFNAKEQVFLDNLKSELALVIEALKEQEEDTELHDELHEEEIKTYFDNGDFKVRFKGFVDKIKYKKEDTRTVIAIIDYKTGKVKLDLTTIPDGIGMQLPIYLYLASKSKELQNTVVAGFYLQHILPNGLTKYSEDEEYEDQVKENFLLQGYSNSDVEILSMLDKNYDNSRMISGIKINKDGSFRKGINILSSEQIDRLRELAENKIKESAKLITNAEFNIAPKVKGNENLGCQYCKYRDICFRTPDDYVELEKRTKEQVIGGEE